MSAEQMVFEGVVGVVTSGAYSLRGGLAILNRCGCQLYGYCCYCCCYCCGCGYFPVRDSLKRGYRWLCGRGCYLQ